MASSLTVDIFVSVDGWAGSDGLPGYFGYPGPQLEEWIMAELAAPQLMVIGAAYIPSSGGASGRGTWQVLGPDNPARQDRVLPHLDPCGLAQHADLQPGSCR
jgi:hypothetical protein